jgi:sulfur relay (sulfurtransferase) complex TusBCD TusD component (DsrE family)
MQRPAARARETRRRIRPCLPARRRGHLRPRRPANTGRLLQPRAHLGAAIARGAEIGLCGTCIDARAIHEDQLVDGTRRSTLEELTDWTIWADKVISF